MNLGRVVRLVAAGLCAAHGLAAPVCAQSAVDAYASEAARELVRLARVHRSTVDRRIESYETTARERFTVSVRAGMIERTVYRRETAVRIDWRRDGAVHLDILGMREHVPIANPAIRR